MTGPLAATVRVRLVALILVSAVPLFALAASIAVQSYDDDKKLFRDSLLRSRDGIVARGQTEIEEAAKLLQAIAANPAVQSGTVAECDRYLRGVFDLQGGRYDNISVVVDDHVRCGAYPGGEPTPEPVIVLSAPVQRPGGSVGIVRAGLSIEWLASFVGTNLPSSQMVGWLVGHNSRIVPINGASETALPRESDLRELLGYPSGTGSQARTSQGGDAFGYVVARPHEKLTVIVGEAASRETARAREGLAYRLAGLGTLLAAGILAMAFGAERSVARPIRRLSRAVRVWRDGGRFDPGLAAGAPAEVLEMAAVFRGAADALAVREEQLRVASTQQELLMQEIHHRVKNNLQIVASLLNLQSSRIRQPEARAEFQAARDRIRALATLHRHLYAHGEVHSINMRSFLVELCEQLLQTMGETAAGGRIQLHIDAPELKISSDQAVPIALIVTETVSNAAKYAFPGGRSGHIRVRLSVAGEPGQATAVLTIEDDGVGIPAGRGETESGTRDGIGLHLIRGFARQLGATLSINRDSGTRYLVEIPLHGQAAGARAPGELQDAAA